MNKSIVLPLTVAISLTASLVGPALSIPTAFAATDRLFSATISPTASDTFESQSYTLRVTNSHSSDRDIRSVTAAVPSGWTVDGDSLELDGDADFGWSVSLVSGFIKAKKNSGFGGGIDDGSWFTIEFTATAPGVPGVGVFVMRAFENNDYSSSGGQEFIQTGSEPSVTVSGVPENTEARCADDIDNDGDGSTDLEDADCAPFIPEENTEEACSDSVDNDLDTLVDLADPDCEEFVPPPPAVDVCPNLEGDQETVPEGYELVEGECVVIPPPVVDVCPNLEGDQETVPDGYELVEDECVVIPPPPPPPPVDPTGSITVCKVIADVLGDLVTVSSETDVPTGSFTVSGFTPAQT